jgi:hypothetical protein
VKSIFSILILGVLAIIWYVVSIFVPPSDSYLISNFKGHEREFETLTRMIKTNEKLVRVDSDWTEPGDLKSIGVSPSRIDEYRSLFSNLHIPRGFTASRKPEGYEFLAYAFGTVSHGKAKGYVFSEQELGPLENDLDKHQFPPGHAYDIVYRKIQGNWYLFLERD